MEHPHDLLISLEKVTWKMARLTFLPLKMMFFIELQGKEWYKSSLCPYKIGKAVRVGNIFILAKLNCPRKKLNS
jgi:hypothetical protein